MKTVVGTRAPSSGRGGGSMRPEAMAGVMVKVLIALIFVHLMMWELSPEAEALVGSSLRGRLDEIAAAQTEVRKLIDAAAPFAPPDAPAPPRSTRAPTRAPAAAPPPPPPRARAAAAAAARPEALPAGASPLGTIVVVVVAHDRAASARACLGAILAQEGAASLRAVGVSMDAPDAFGAMRAAAAGAAADAGVAVATWEHAYAARPGTPRGFARTPLSKISEHVRRALESGFAVPGAERVLILEDDLRVAGDFLALFAAAAAAMDRDPELWCASAWNDNAGPGAAGYSWRPGALRRTTYFPGLGWMVGRRFWDAELRARWPLAPTTGWDHWLRAVTSRAGGECAFPEIPRVRHAATDGSTNVRGSEAKALERWAFAGERSSEGEFFLDGDAAALEARVRAAPRLARLDAAALAAIPPGEARSAVVSLPEDHARLARLLDLWHTEPRGYDARGVLSLRRKNGVALYLLDARRCPWLDDDARRPPHSSALVAAPGAGVSCDETCRARGSRCAPDLLPFADTCAALAAAFDCPQGCGHQIGVELPAVVTLESEFTVGQCLIANGGAVPTCNSKHRATRRLCVCV